MKKVAIFFTCLLFVIVNAIGGEKNLPESYLPEFKCELQDSGEVKMAINYVTDEGGQRLTAFIGHEKWSQPYKVFKQCEAMILEILGEGENLWGDYECDSYNMGVAKRHLRFELTSEGQRIWNHKTTRIYFYPQLGQTILPSFLRYKEIPGCDPY